MSGHSAKWRPVTSEVRVHVFRSSEMKKRAIGTFRKRSMTHFFVGSCQKILGSRSSECTPWLGTTGFPLYRVHVRPRSRL
jgi:hypothetical protein